ncbi:hypothetical protein P4E94_08455 [Pontiellaceae bacterium B12219]|nr:hypothetical protein [Pontiellaceae bacterium B12219]
MKMNHPLFFVVQTGLLAGGLLLSGCTSSKVAVGPPLERVIEWDANPQYDFGTEEGLLAWLNTDTPVSISLTPEDRWANQYAKCMDPFVVDWQQSNLTNSTQGFVMVQNVQVGGNPILGTSRNGTVRIPVGAVERVELVVVRYRLKGLGKYGGHVQLRFVFDQERRPELLDAQGNPDREQPYLDDLMVSWEAWRPTNTPWEFIAGLEPENYTLTARMYSGSQRFLNDSLRGAVWDCYPLKLPVGVQAEDTVLYCCLMMGDLATRKTLTDMMRAQLVADKGPDAGAQWTENEKEQARARFLWKAVPDEWFKQKMAHANLSYNSIERSCITCALLQIEVAMERLYDVKNLGPRTEIEWAPSGKLPAWFSDAVSDDKSGELFAAPRAFFWAINHKSIFPYKSYIPLEKAGMLETDKKGKIKRYRYGLKEGSPYGKLERNLM